MENYGVPGTRLRERRRRKSYATVGLACTDAHAVVSFAPLAMVTSDIVNAPAEMQENFRYATLVDRDEVVELVESAYRGEVSRAGWTTEADLLGGQRTDPEEISSILGNDSARLLLLTQGNAILGCVVVRREPKGAYIGMLAVRPGLQTNGLGKRLLAGAEHCARAEFGAKRVRMTVIEQRHELIGWYERRGYQRTSQTEPFPYGDPRFGLPKRDDLRFVVLEKPL